MKTLLNSLIEEQKQVERDYTYLRHRIPVIGREHVSKEILEIEQKLEKKLISLNILIEVYKMEVKK